MSLKERMEALDKLFTLFFLFSPKVIGIVTSFGLDVRLLWLPMGALFFWALYIYQYRAVYHFSYNEELSLIERMRGLSFFFTFPILAIIFTINFFTGFGNNWVNSAILGIVGATCSFIIDLSIPRTFFEKQTALFRKAEKTKLSDVLTATANVTIYFSVATVLIDRAVLEGTIVVVFAIITVTPFGFLAYWFERKSRKLANDLAISLRKTRWMQHYLGQKRRAERRQKRKKRKKLESEES